MNTKINFTGSGPFWVLIAAFLAILYGWLPLVSYDMASRAILGKVIISNWSAMQFDHFTYTAAGKYYVNSEWLCDVIVYLLELSFGEIGPIVFRIVAIFLFAIALILIIRLYTRKPIYIIPGILIVFAISGDRFLQVGPALVTYALFGFYIYLWELARLKNKYFYLYLIIPLHLIWFNCHGGALLGLVVIGAMALGELIGRKNKKIMEHTFLVILLCLVVGLINPYGINIYLYAFGLVFGDDWSVVRKILVEWHPVISDYAKNYSMVIFLPIILFGLSISFVRSGSDFCWAHIFGLVPTFYLGFKGIRELPEFATMSILAMSHNFSNFKLEGKIWRKIFQGAVVAIGILLLLYAVIVYRAKYQIWGNPAIIETDFEPKAAVDFLEDNNIHGRPFNGFYTGPYLEVRRWPKEKVFVDGRLHLFDTDFHRKYFELYRSNNPGEVFEKLDKEWNFDYVILSARDVRLNFLILDYLLKSPRWKLIFNDYKGWVFLKK